MDNDLPIFVNPAAGRKDDQAPAVMARAFRAAGARPDIREIGGPGLDRAIRKAVVEGAQVIAVAGGDGTMSTAANVLVQTGVALLPIPFGTRNHFCARCGIADLDTAVDAWRRKSLMLVHVGIVNDRIFINNASCGFYPKVVRFRERLEDFLPRWPAMWLAGTSVLLELPMLHVQIHAASETRRLRTPALWVGIGRNSLRLPANGDAIESEAVLEAVSGRMQSRTGILLTAFSMFRHLKRGIELRDRRLDVVRARQFTLTARKKIDIALDGEPFRMKPPLQFGIRENGLHVIGTVVPDGTDR